MSDAGDRPEDRFRGTGPSPADELARSGDPARWFALRGQSMHAVHPAGECVAFIDSVSGTPQVWTVDAPLAWPEQRTRFAHRATGIRWTPGGDGLLILGDVGGDERDDLLLAGPDGRGGRILHRGAAGRVQVGGFTPDGAGLFVATTCRDPRFFDLAVIDTVTGDRRDLAGPDAFHVAGPVAPDGRRAVAFDFRGSFAAAPFVVDLATGSRTPLLRGAAPFRLTDAAWSSDGSTVLLVGNAGRDRPALIRVPAGGGTGDVLLGPADGEVEEVAVHRPTGTLVAVVNRRGVSTLEWLAADGRHLRSTAPRGGRAVIARPRFAAACPNPVLIAAVGDAVTPSRLERFTPGDAGDDGEPVTRPDRAGFAAADLAAPEEVRFPSHDGVEISGFLFRAPGSRSVVVMVHGGPESQYRPTCDPTVQLLVANGISVFAPNVRGSTGYGAAFAALDDGRRRLDAVEDLRAVHARLVADDVADAGRIAVMGGSYGGYMTLMAVTHQPELWAAGVSVVGIAHLGTFLRETGPFRRAFRAAEYGDPEELADWFEETAPLTHAGRIRCPLLLIQGANDPRVPLAEAERMAAAAREAGARVELLVYPDEGHGLHKRHNRIEAYGRAVAFLGEAFDPAAG